MELKAVKEYEEPKYQTKEDNIICNVKWDVSIG